ncbi:MAG TPA: OmpH family outer membrane protein [Terriglobales bacterium]|jgi:outer membrane protein|nr:OmpH family outer membrane protein [Terriglobales bacterium]
MPPSWRIRPLTEPKGDTRILISTEIKESLSAPMTRKIVSTLSVAALLAVGAFAQAAETNAAPSTSTNSLVAGPTKVAIINIQAAIATTNEGQRDLEALQKKFEPKQIELKSLSDEVDNLKKQLAAQTDKLNEDERNKRVQTIESKQKTLQRNLEDAQNDYQSQSNEIAQRIGGKLMQSLDNYAKQNGYAVVIDVSSQQSPVLWAAQSVDITKPVIDAYNTVSGVAAPATRPAAPSASPGAVTHRPATSTPAASKPAAPSATPK